MTSSRHRLTLAVPRRPIDPIYPLEDLQNLYLDLQNTLGRSANTYKCYQATFKLFGQFLAASQIRPNSLTLSPQIMQQFARWLRETPVPSHRGTTIRS